MYFLVLFYLYRLARYKKLLLLTAIKPTMYQYRQSILNAAWVYTICR